MKQLTVLFLIFAFLSSCKKEEKTCYTYTVKEWCVPKVSGVYGCQTPTYKSNMIHCENYTEGQTIVRYENSDLVMYNQFTDKKQK